MDGATQKEQDARVEKLWKTLDTGKEGQLDREGLKKGLRRIDHRKAESSCIHKFTPLMTCVALHNADSLLDDVLKVVDTNKDGRIQFSGLHHKSCCSVAALTRLYRVPCICEADRKGIMATFQEH